ncbi:hypothetical protein CLAFUW4_11930 [Fulvia fulva]|nr:hypothetical protein CLAFUR4_11935 [Fulvia fulva]WPV18209.1 hypothetical protein CLAFUW4_11930 [Fulvia fulva]
MTPSWDTFANELQNDLFVRITVSEVGLNDTVYRVSYLTLKHAAPELAKQVVDLDRYQYAFSEKELKLDYPESPEVHIALYYIIHKELPSDLLSERDHEEIAIKCWCFGHQFKMAHFQNAVMRKVLLYLQSSNLSLDAKATAFKTLQQGSVMRRLLAEELVVGIRDRERSYGELKQFEGIGGFLTEFVKAMDEYDDDEIDTDKRLDDDRVGAYLV